MKKALSPRVFHIAKNYGESDWLLLVVLGCLLAACASTGQPVKNETRFENGKLRWQYSLLEGEWHGESTTYYPNGAPQSVGYYVKGKRHGLFRFYLRNDRERRVLYWQDKSVWSSWDETWPPEELVAALEESHLALGTMWQLKGRARGKPPADDDFPSRP